MFTFSFKWLHRQALKYQNHIWCNGFVQLTFNIHPFHGLRPRVKVHTNQPKQSTSNFHCGLSHTCKHYILVENTSLLLNLYLSLLHFIILTFWKLSRKGCSPWFNLETEAVLYCADYSKEILVCSICWLSLTLYNKTLCKWALNDKWTNS